jgi:hypothetical protein
MKPSTISQIVMPKSVVAQVLQLPALPMPEIKALWQKLFNTETPTHNRKFLEKRLAYQLQENEYRKVNPQLLERNQKQIDALIETGKLRKRDRDTRPDPGTVLCREYHGVEYQVTVTLDGQYEFQGRPYPSLSMIAREITGTRWSGPVFFGLKTYDPKTPARKTGGRK